MNFDDREKKLDRRTNKFFVHFRKFQDELTCPACNIPKEIAIIREAKYDHKKRKFIKKKWVHNADECFRWYSQLIIARAKTKSGKFYPTEYLQDIIERGLNHLKEMNKKYTESGT